MAAVMGSRFILTNAIAKFGSVFKTEPGAGQNRRVPYQRNETTVYHGLRPPNVVDLIQMQTNLKGASSRGRRGSSHKNPRSAVMACGSGMNLIFLGAEMAPWTGGLGDVVGGLPPAMALKIGDTIEKVRFFHCYERGVDRVFVDHPRFLEKVWGKTEGKIYDPVTGIDYEDNQLRFCLLCLAALEAPRIPNLTNEYFSEPYGEDVVFIANDWHTALLPCYLKSKYKPNGLYKNAKVMEGKALNKESLQAEVGLPVDRNIPLLAFFGRLEEQKGSDILAEAIPKFIEDVQLIVLGTGKKKMEEQIKQLEEKYPTKARGVTKFNVPLAHNMMMAGADYIIIPSRFEPCGQIQLQGMRYGTIPICSSTGGLVDTVEESGTGFHMGSFNVNWEAVDPADVTAIISTVRRALKVYGTPLFGEMIQNCMAQDLIAVRNPIIGGSAKSRG